MQHFANYRPGINHFMEDRLFWNILDFVIDYVIDIDSLNHFGTD
ncbi:hypothetical protein NPIL_107281, partial [Nephila pilipes]